MSNTQNPSNVLADLIKILKPSEVLNQSSSDYAYHSSTFSAHREKHPALVFAPESLESLSRIVHDLYASGLDFDVRGHGFKCSSSEAVVLSMAKFNDFAYDKETKLATIGVGLTWAEVCSRMSREDPEYATLVARTADVGVGGSVLLGGYSWRSGRLGCISDPANLVDAEVVKFDGSIVMASKEPELMWALRGGGGGFGVVTKVVLRAYPCSTKIWAGNILVPRSELPRVARGMAELMKDQDPAFTGFLYVTRGRVKESIRGEGEQKDAYSQGDHLVVYVYHEHGEEHGRKAFGFLLETPGAIDRTKVTNIEGVTNGQANVGDMRGKMNIEFQTFGLSNLSYDIIMKTVDWFDMLPSYGGSIQQSAMVVFEFKTLGPINGGTAKDCAYPRPSDLKHILLISTGCDANVSAEEWSTAHQVALKAPQIILGEDVKPHVTPPALEDFHDKRATYGEHYEKLVQVRRRYDPEGRFKGLVPVA